MPDIQNETQNETLIIHLRDNRLSEESLVDSVANELNALLRQSSEKKLVINLHDVQFMNSSMISKLVEFNANCNAQNVQLRLCELNSNLVEVFNLMQLQRLMQIHPAQQDALDSF